MKTGKKGYKLLDNNAFFRYIIMKTQKKSFIKIYHIYVFFLFFHSYVSKNALLDMCYFLIFGHIYIYIYIYIYILFSVVH